MSGVENFEFHEKRAEWASLSKIKNELRAIKTAARARLDKHVSDTMITSLLSPEWFKINQWDTLAGISAITAVWNRLSFNDEADHIEIWDIITIWLDKEDPNKRALFRNGTKVWEVLEGYRESTTQAVASLKQDVEGESNKRETSTVSRRNRSERWRQSIDTNENHDWDLLANYISERWYPVWENWAYCGKNVWEMLLEFGIYDLPRSWRHGKLWDQFCEDSRYFTKVAISNPADAKAWWILVYDEWFGPQYKWKDNKRIEVPRYKYGHVEVALWGGRTYFWNVASKPGWSLDAARNPEWAGFKWYVYYPTWLSNNSAMV